MRLDHLLSRESDIQLKLVFGWMDRESKFQYCSILRVMQMIPQRSIRDSETRNAERRGGIAQLGEHLLCKQGVKGSNPFISTTWADSSAG